jgi:uncharacterized protein
MKWQISKLIKESVKEIEINEEVDFSDAVKRSPDIRNLSLIRVIGTASIESSRRMVEFNLKIKGEMTLGCALTLNDVIYPFEATIEPIFTWNSENDEDSEEYLVKGDSVELAPVVWQEIFLQIPLRVVKDGAYEEIKRQGIEILTEKDLEKEGENKIDPRFSVLEGVSFED